MKVGVRVMPKTEVLDSQGRAVSQTLKHHGQQVESCRIGKFIELVFPDLSEEEAMVKAHEIAEFVLYNPLTENYEVSPL